MSLTLNDEQEKRLREWYHMDAENSWKPNQAGRGLRLSEAIAPLMKPWRTLYSTMGLECTGIVIGPHGEQFRVQSDHAQHICKLLNESEGKR